MICSLKRLRFPQKVKNLLGTSFAALAIEMRVITHSAKCFRLIMVEFAPPALSQEHQQEGLLNIDVREGHLSDHPLDQTKATST